MVLGFSEDFSTNVSLDSQLKDIPTSGLYLNSGVHPSINLKNLLDFLPNVNFTFAEWDIDTTYGDFLTTRNVRDIVKVTDEDTQVVTIYQSITSNNVGNDPIDETGDWVATNIESLRLKIFFEQVKDRVYRDLRLTKRLVENQYLYEQGDVLKLLSNDYAAWVLEPKGSDYVSIRINQIAIQADGTDPIDVYIINQNTLLDTIQITPNNGELVFRDVDIVLSGKGSFKIAIDSQNVYVGGKTIDPLKFNGFVAYTANGIGDTPNEATYSYSTNGIGVGINVSAYLDATQYIENNIDFMANFIRSTFEIMTFEMFLHNSNNSSNRSQRIQMNQEILLAELKNMQAETLIRRYSRERKKVESAMQKTFDNQLNNHDGLEINLSSV